MSLTNPYRQHNYMGEFANDGAALAFIQANKWDSSGDGLGSPQAGMWYFNTTDKQARQYDGSSWVKQVQGIIDHTDGTQITNVGSNTHANIDTHIGDATKHRVINDSGTSATELWSASKLNTEFGAVTSGYSRRKKVVNIVDNTAAPPTEVTGDRYILDFTGGGVHVDWDGASVGDIVEFDGASWISDPDGPIEGWVAYADTPNKDALYVYDGTPVWELRDISIENHNDLGSIDGGTVGEYYHLTQAQHTDLTDGNDASSHKHDDRYYTETELGSVTPSGEGAKLIGTDAKTNLGGAAEVEAALTFLDGQDPVKYQAVAGNPNAGAGTAGAAGDRVLDATNGIFYSNIDGTNSGWVVVG